MRRLEDRRYGVVVKNPHQETRNAPRERDRRAGRCGA